MIKQQRNISFLLFFLSVSVATQAQIFVKLDATGAANGGSWADAYTDLQLALDDTNGEEIWVAQGTYKPLTPIEDSVASFSISRKLQIYGGFEGNETMLSQRDITAHPTILTADINGDDVAGDFELNRSDNAQHVVLVYNSTNASEAISFDGLTIRNGHTSANDDVAFQFYSGGGILTFSTISVHNCRFLENFGRSGASIYVSSVIGGGVNSEISDCYFFQNRATAQSAGIFLEEVGNVEIKRCQFISNQTRRGALYSLRSLNVRVDSCQFDNNIGINDEGYGGALFDWNSIDLEISNCNFSNNKDGNGGAIYLDGRDDTSPSANNIRISNCFFSGNTTSDWGGGSIYNYSSSFTMDNCFFNSNRSDHGAGIANTGSTKEVIIKNSSFAQSSQGGWGGGILCYGSDSNFLIEDCSFENNQTAVSGGAMMIGFEANVEINRCEFLSNQAQWGGAIYVQNSFTTININESLFETNTAGNNGGAINYGAAGAFNIDNCEFYANKSTVGGAIAVTEDRDTTERVRFMLTNSILNFNEATSQGAGININECQSIIYNNEFAYNTNIQGVAGGALSLNIGDGISRDIILSNNSIVNNFANIGSGIATFTTDNDSELIVCLQNNLLYNPGGRDYEVEAGTPIINSLGGNISEDDSAEDILTHVTDQIQVSDMYFVDSQSDFRLTEMSPAVDAGVNDGAPEFDNEGFPRMGTVDVGAYEFQGTSSNEEILINGSNLKLFPNPTSAFINIELDNDWKEEISLALFDIKGKLVLTKRWVKKTDQFSERIDIETLETGVYKVYISDGDEVMVKSFVKQ